MHGSKLVKKLHRLVIFFLLLSLHQATHAKTIVVGGSANLKASIYGSWSTAIYQEAFKRLGYEFSYLGYPGQRVRYLFEDGKLDGEVNRISSYNHNRKNLIRVKESHFTMTSNAYSNIPNLSLNSWEDLDNTEYKVEYRRGSKLFRDLLTPRVPTKNLSQVNTTEQGVKKLILGRTDVFVELDFPVTYELQRLDSNRYDRAKIYTVGVLATKPSYLFLHKKHEKLAQKLSLVLREMKQEGLIIKLKQRVLAELK